MKSQKRHKILNFIKEIPKEKIPELWNLCKEDYLRVAKETYWENSEAWWEVNREAWEKETLDTIKSSKIIGYEDGKIQGFIIFQDMQDYILLFAWHLIKELRGKDLAFKLYDYIEKKAKREGKGILMPISKSETAEFYLALKKGYKISWEDRHIYYMKKEGF